MTVNCAAIPEALLESELFGHARGAFTGAVQAQVGRIPAAQGGTLFLDEISEMPFCMQAKLLRFLEQKEVQCLGAAKATRVDVRVIAASNADLADRAGRGEFRPSRREATIGPGAGTERSRPQNRRGRRGRFRGWPVASPAGQLQPGHATRGVAPTHRPREGTAERALSALRHSAPTGSTGYA